MAKTRGAELVSISSFDAESFRGKPGFCRVARTSSGRWWLVSPEDRPFFSKAVAAVNRHGRAGSPPAHPSAYAQALARSRGADDPLAFSRAAERRLKGWQVDTLGPWAEPGLSGAGFFETTLVNFRAAGVPVIRLHGVNLPDVFDPGWSDACNAHAAMAVAPWLGRTDFIGYYTDDGLGWGEPRPDRPSLLQVCLSLEPSYPAYHAAWEFVLAPYAGDLASLAREWRIELVNREALRQRTLAERPINTAGYAYDEARFAREFARRYFLETSVALRRHDPHHLILGCRFAHPPEESVLEECVYPQVDVVSWQCHGPEFERQVESCTQVTGMPQLLVGFGLSNELFRTASFQPHSGPTRLERMLREGRRTLTAACSHPAIVGYEWARWADEPEEMPPFGAGLVHVDDREAVEHTELILQINARAERRRSRVR